MIYRTTLIEEIEKIIKNLKPSLVRRKEQLKGIIWLLKQLPDSYYNKDILKKLEEKYGKN